MAYLDNTIKKYLDDLSAKIPAPGGGSVAALTGALGCGLLLMVANYTYGKEKYKQYEADIFEMIKSLEELKSKFSRLVDEDVSAYSELSAALKTKDEAVAQDALKKALRVPLEVSEASMTGMDFAQELVGKGNTNLVTDTGIAAILFESAFLSGKLNVDINLAQIKDAQFKNKITESLKRLEKDIRAKKEGVLKGADKIITKGN